MTGLSILKGIALAFAAPILGTVAGVLFLFGLIMFPVPIPGSTAIFWLPAGAIFSPVEKLWNAEPALGKDRTPSTPALIIERRKEANRAWAELLPAAAAH